MDKKGAVKTIKPVAEKCGVRDEELDELFVFERDLFNKYPLNLSAQAKEEIMEFSKELARAGFSYDMMLEKVLGDLYGFWARTGVDLETEINEKGAAQLYIDVRHSNICNRMGWEE
jgi:hypothetical protein